MSGVENCGRRALDRRNINKNSNSDCDVQSVELSLSSLSVLCTCLILYTGCALRLGISMRSALRLSLTTARAWTIAAPSLDLSNTTNLEYHAFQAQSSTPMSGFRPRLYYKLLQDCKIVLCSSHHSACVLSYANLNGQLGKGH